MKHAPLEPFMTRSKRNVLIAPLVAHLVVLLTIAPSAKRTMSYTMGPVSSVGSKSRLLTINVRRLRMAALSMTQHRFQPPNLQPPKILLLLPP